MHFVRLLFKFELAHVSLDIENTYLRIHCYYVYIFSPIG